MLRRRESSVETISGSRAEPPSPTRLTAATNSVDVGDPVLQQVSGAISGVREQRQRQPELDVLREHEHADRRDDGQRISSAARMPSSVCVGGSRISTIATSGGKLRTFSSNSCRRAALGDDVEAGVSEQPGETVAQQHAVLGDRYAHGISALTRVP